MPPTSGAHLSGFGDHRLHAVACRIVDQRAEVGRFILHGAEAEALHRLRQRGYEGVVPALMDEDAIDRGALLTALDKAAGGKSPGGCVDVGVLEYNSRSLTAELEIEAFERSRTGRHDPLADRARPREAQHINVRRGREQFAAFAANFVEAVDHAPGQLRYIGKAAHHGIVEERGGERRLDYDGATR